MEDRHIVIANYNLGSGGAIADSIPRSFAAVYDGHNGAQTAEEACERWGSSLPLLSLCLEAVQRLYRPK